MGSILLVPSPLLGTLGSLWSIRHGHHQGSHQQWAPVTLKPTVQGNQWEPRWWKPLVSPMSIMVLTPWGLTWQWLMVGATIPRGILYEGTSWMVKPEGLLGQQIYTWMPQPPHLYAEVCYGQGNCSSTFLNCHGIGRKVGWFPNPCTLLQWVEMWHLWPHLWLGPLPVNIFHRKELPYPGLSPLLWWGQS